MSVCISVISRPIPSISMLHLDKYTMGLRIRLRTWIYSVYKECCMWYSVNVCERESEVEVEGGREGERERERGGGGRERERAYNEHNYGNII